MKKKVLVIFVTIAFIAFGFIAHNTFAGPLDPPGLDDGNGSSGSTYTCSSGGPGSTSCSVATNGGGGGITGGTSCSVTCGGGYYACCNAWQNKCQCRKL